MKKEPPSERKSEGPFTVVATLSEPRKRGCFAPLAESGPGWWEEWINKFVDFDQSGENRGERDCVREERMGER